jgi:hypothetical protein
MLRKLLLAFLILAWPSSTEAETQFATVERGVDRPGADFANYPSPNVDLCRAMCASHQGSPRCVAYTFVAPTGGAAEGTCWLKSGIPAPVPASSMDSGLYVYVKYGDNGLNYPGSDYSSFETTNPVECQDRCLAEPGTCRAWTWVKPGIQNPGGNCWLKSQVPEPAFDSCCISGQGAPQ